MSGARVAVISGAGTGIGAAVALALADTCSRLVLVGRRLERLHSVAGSLSASHPHVRVDTMSVDLADVDAVIAFQDWAHEELACLDVLVNNAGSPQPRIEGSLHSVAAVWESTWRANTLSAVLLTEGLKDLMPRPGGRIVHIGSAAAEHGTGSPAYASAKGALETFAVTLMRELGPEGITANVVAPGYTDGTELVAGRISPERRERLLSGIAARRPAEPHEIAAVVSFIASREASFVNGQVILANGGSYLPG
jgi:3-oxoacyl-[acyl-carrier protein] reductase